MHDEGEMQNGGAIFRQLRKQRMLSLSAVGDKSGLSRFERGVGPLHLDQAIKIFDKVHLDLEDFSILVNHNKVSGIKSLIERILHAFLLCDVKQLLALEHKCEKTDPLLATGIKILMWEPFLTEPLKKNDICPAKITEHDITFVSSYLFSIDYWDQYNLFLAALYAPVLSERMADYCMRYFVKRAEIFKALPEHNKILHFFLNKMAVHCIENSNAALAKEILDAAALLFSDEALLSKVVHRYIVGFWDYCFHDDDDDDETELLGEKKMQASLTVLKDFGEPNYYHLLSQHHDYAVKH